jgi:hypothetical protein
MKYKKEKQNVPSPRSTCSSPARSPSSQFQNSPNNFQNSPQSVFQNSPCSVIQNSPNPSFQLSPKPNFQPLNTNFESPNPNFQNLSAYQPLFSFYNSTPNGLQNLSPISSQLDGENSYFHPTPVQNFDSWFDVPAPPSYENTMAAQTGHFVQNTQINSEHYQQENQFWQPHLC